MFSNLNKINSISLLLNLEAHARLKEKIKISLQVQRHSKQRGEICKEKIVFKIGREIRKIESIKQIEI